MFLCDILLSSCNWHIPPSLPLNLHRSCHFLPFSLTFSVCKTSPIPSYPSWPPLLSPLSSSALTLRLLNKHTSQSLCSLTPRLCRLSEQSQERSRESTRRKEEGTVGEKEREGAQLVPFQWQLQPKRWHRYGAFVSCPRRRDWEGREGCPSICIQN